MILSFSFPLSLPFKRAGVSIGVATTLRLDSQSRLPSDGARDPRKHTMTLFAFLKQSDQ